jgi:hypothetical protein
MSKENEVFTDDLVKRLREDQPATQDMGSTMQCALQDAAAQRIEELEAKLAKATAEIEEAWKVPKSDASYGILQVMIKYALAELKGV